MKKIGIAGILDVVFTLAVGFLVFYIVLDYFVEKPYSIIFSFALAVLLTLSIYTFANGKMLKKKIKKEDGKKAEELLAYLSVSEKKKSVECVTAALDHLELKYEKKRSYILVPEKSIAAFINTEPDGLTKTEIVKAVNVAPQNAETVIFACFVSEEVGAFAKRFKDKVRIISGENLYLFLKHSEALPDIDENKIVIPKNRPVLKKVFDKKRAFKYLLFGLSFLGLSFLVRYKLYYIIVGSLFIALALISRIFFAKTKDGDKSPTL